MTRQTLSAAATAVWAVALLSAPGMAQLAPATSLAHVRTIDSTFTSTLASPFARVAFTPPSPTPSPIPAGETRATALMIVGATAFIAGSLIGRESGRIIMVGGAVLGLYGLWRYLQ